VGFRISYSPVLLNEKQVHIPGYYGRRDNRPINTYFNRNKPMKYRIILILFIASIFSCRCPQIISSVKETSDTTKTHQSDTSTTFKSDTIYLPGAVLHDTINFSSLCDSLAKGLKVNKEVKVKGGTIKVVSDSLGHGSIECETDSLTHVIDSLTLHINTVDSVTVRNNKETTTVVEVVKETGFQKFCKWFFYGTLSVLVVLGIGIYLGKR